MKNKILAISSLLLFPFTSHAQATAQNMLTGFANVLNDVVIPFLMGIAFMFFAINAIRYFVFGINGAGDKKQGVASGRERARALALYGITAFVLIIIFWGMINLLAESIGLEGETQDQFDYVTEMGP